MKLPKEPAENRHPWVYVPNQKIIDFRGIVNDMEIPYYIELERCGTSAQVLDWIVQISKKTWADDKCVANLVRILDDVLDLQANYCSFGVERNK